MQTETNRAGARNDSNGELELYVSPLNPPRMHSTFAGDRLLVDHPILNLLPISFA